MAKIPARWSSRDKLGTVDFEWIAKSISRTGIRPLTHPPEGASTRTAATRLRVIGIGVLVGQRRDARSVDGDDSAAIYKSAVPSLTLVPYSWRSLRGLSVSSRSPTLFISSALGGLCWVSWRVSGSSSLGYSAHRVSGCQTDPESPAASDKRRSGSWPPRYATDRRPRG